MNPAKTTWSIIGYISENGRTTIHRRISQRTGCPDEVVWELVYRGMLMRSTDTLKEAKTYYERHSHGFEERYQRYTENPT